MLEITLRHPKHERERENNCLKEVKEKEEDHQAKKNKISIFKEDQRKAEETLEKVAETFVN